MNSTAAVPDSDPRLLRLAPEDNICAVTSTVEAGETVQIEGRAVQVPIRVPMGHKIAIAVIPAGQPVRKYGLPIGTAAQRIRPGDYVHTHNLRSSYLPTFTLSRE